MSVDAFRAAFRLKGQSSIVLVGLGHCGVHWVFAVFYLIAALMLCANLMAVMLPNANARSQGAA